MLRPPYATSHRKHALKAQSGRISSGLWHRSRELIERPVSDHKDESSNRLPGTFFARPWKSPLAQEIFGKALVRTGRAHNDMAFLQQGPANLKAAHGVKE